MSTYETDLPDVEATHELGARIGQVAPAGLVICLDGELGAGKTSLVKGIAVGLGVPKRETVRSPSYFLLNSYTGGRLVLDHFDAYFMERGADLVENGLLEFVDAGHLVVIEWGSRLIETLPDDHLVVSLAFAGPGRRAGLAGARPLGRAVVAALVSSI